MNNKNKMLGLGDMQFVFAVYIENKPVMPEYESLTQLKAIESEQIDDISKACGNGWRKVFNVYAKLLYALDKQYFEFSSLAPTWQSYRDNYLLQKGSGTALIFTPPQFDITAHSSSKSGEIHKILHIICGRTYAKKLMEEGKLGTDFIWLDEEFAIDLSRRVIICPYFDYRQLSNHKIERLSMMLTGLLNGRVEDLR